MPDRIHLTVAVVVPSTDSEQQTYLMVEETDKRTGKLVFNQPAGHVEPGESILEAALRETLEETAWHVELTGFIGFYTYKAPHGIIYHRAAFVASRVAFNEGFQIDPDIISTHWLTREQLLEQSEKLRSPMVLKAIDDYEKGTIYPLSLFR